MDDDRAVIATALRTPFGKYRGALANIRPDDLLAFLMKSLLERNPQLNPAELDDIIIGDSNGAGEDNRNIARMSSLLAGIPVSVPGMTVNRLCGSGAEAIGLAARLITSGDAKHVLAGGVESMSRAPWIVERNENEPSADSIFHQSTVGWRLTNPKMPDQWSKSLGICADDVATEYGISRKSQDEWAVRSHQNTAQAWDSGFLGEWVTSPATLREDESLRRETTVEILSGLKSAFSENGTITAGNASPISDGSILALITNKRQAANLNLDPIASIISVRSVGVSPERFTTAPIFAIRKLLDVNNLKVSDIDLWEINEAFASMVLTVLGEFPEMSLDKVNVNGGAIAIGHPIGASAGRAVIDCARELKRRGGKFGVATACIGVGQGIAVLLST
jgi:acetyl-CoA acetyltransferase family protein